MSRLYLTPTPNATADSARDNVSSAIEQTGLIDIGGAATENIATENVDLRLRGRVQYGPRLNRKVATELESLAESRYTAVPFVDDSTTGALELVSDASARRSKPSPHRLRPGRPER